VLIAGGRGGILPGPEAGESSRSRARMREGRAGAGGEGGPRVWESGARDEAWVRERGTLTAHVLHVYDSLMRRPQSVSDRLSALLSTRHSSAA
jgi:hypothetical protein